MIAKSKNLNAVPPCSIFPLLPNLLARVVLMTSVTDEVASAAIHETEPELSWMLRHRIALFVSLAPLLTVVVLVIIWRFRSPSPRASLIGQNHGVLLSDRIRVTGTTEAVL